MRWEVRIAGLGGQGAITAGNILGRAAVLYDGKEAVVTEGYSPYITGGWSRADVVISDRAIDYPLVSKPDVLVAMYQDGLNTNWKGVKPSGIILIEANMVDASVVRERKVIEVPSLSIAEGLGRRVAANIVLLGALTSATGIVSAEAMKKALADRFPKAVELNVRAFDAGYRLVHESLKGEEVASTD